MQSQKKYKPTFCIEFLPLKTEEGNGKQRESREELAGLNPAYISSTYGVGGSPQLGILDTVLVFKETSMDAAPHLNCVGFTKDNLRDLRQTYIDDGIHRIAGLPSGMREMGELRYANGLMEFIRAETGDRFYIEVAASPETHPQAKSARV